MDIYIYLVFYQGIYFFGRQCKGIGGGFKCIVFKQDIKIGVQFEGNFFIFFGIIGVNVRIVCYCDIEVVFKFGKIV